MKKFFILSILLTLVAFYALPSFAATTTSAEVNNVNQIILGSAHSKTVKLSANVNAEYNYPADGASYSAKTYNPKGNGKEYGLSSGSSLVYYKSGVAAIKGTQTGTSSDLSGWTVLGK
jgi:hypothetical protein